MQTTLRAPRWTVVPWIVVAWTSTATAADDRFFLFVSGKDAPSQALYESAWREARSVEPFADAAASKAKIGAVYPRLFEGVASVDRGAIEGDLRAGKAAYFATDFALAETHLARAIDAAMSSPEVLASSAVILGRVADAAALRYANALANKVPEPEARAALREVIVRLPRITPTPTEHAPEVVALWKEIAAGLPQGGLVVNVAPLELERSGTCRLFVHGDDLEALPLAGPVRLPQGEHLIQVRCGLQASWLQRVTVGAAPTTIQVPLRAMMAARADLDTGGLVLVSPVEGDSAALVDAVSQAAGFAGAVVVRPGAPRRAEIGVWRPNLDAPTLSAAGTLSPDGISDVRGVSATLERPADPLSPWPFVIAGAGAAALIGGVVTNVGYLDDRDAGVQDLDATPSAVLYGVGGALLLTGVVLFVLDVTDDGPSAVASPRPGHLAVRF